MEWKPLETDEVPDDYWVQLGEPSDEDGDFMAFKALLAECGVQRIEYLGEIDNAPDMRVLWFRDIRVTLPEHYHFRLLQRLINERRAPSRVEQPDGWSMSLFWG